jgi:RND family efflux transporter MFP subunit
MANLIKKLLARKFLTVGVILALAGISYYGYNSFFGNKNVTRYVTVAAEKSTLIVSITGSGQTYASNQIDIKPKVSGDIVYVGVKNGQEVKAGALLVQLDATDAQKAVRDAEANLESAKLSLEKLRKPADRLSILQAENSLAQAKESKRNAEAALQKAYDDGFNTISNAFLDLPTVMAGLQDILFGNSFSSNQTNLYFYSDTVKNYDEKVNQYRDDTYNTYQTARTAYDKNLDDYKVATRYSDTAQLESLINKTYSTTKAIAEAIKNANNLIQFYKDKLTERNLRPDPKADTALTNLNTYTGKINAHLLNLLNIQNTIKNSSDTIVNSDRLIAEKTEALAKLKAGADELDIRSQELTIKQRENALLDAQEKLADYFIRAPFSGIVAKINVKKGDPVSAGTIIATLITKQHIAEISLNEVDVSKVKVGQKATLTFDAIEGLSITGEVAEIDSVGTVTQGVVTYGVKIVFDTQDERVKPGMSVSAAIITDVKQNVVLVPNSAVKSNGNSQYVEILVNGTPQSKNIEIGLSNDTMTEIVNGLKEGEQVVTQRIIANTSQSPTQQNTGIRIPGLNTGGGGGGFRGGGFGR